MTLTNLNKAPFPYFGGKRHAAPHVWAALGDVDHYVEPFAGSLAVLLERPHPANRPYHSETVNDADGLLVNAWRSIQLSPQATAEAASWPVSEADKSARQIALLRWREECAVDLLAGDATFHDPVMGGWWVWSVAVQIGAFSGVGPWTADPVTGRIVKTGRDAGVTRGLPHLADDGRGVNHAGTRDAGVTRVEPTSTRHTPACDYRALVDADYTDTGGYHPTTMPELRRWFAYLSARLRHVRILNGDWARTVTTGASHTLNVRQGGHVGYFLDPPYDSGERDAALYVHDDGSVAADVNAWCAANGDNPRKRIAVAGFESEHANLEALGWRVVDWFANGHLRGGYRSDDSQKGLW